MTETAIKCGRVPDDSAVLGPQPASAADRPLPLLLTEDELIALLRIPEISNATDHRNVIENLKRIHNLPCIHICKTPLYPFDAVRQWILDKVEKERR